MPLYGIMPCTFGVVAHIHILDEVESKDYCFIHCIALTLSSLLLVIEVCVILFKLSLQQPYSSGFSCRIPPPVRKNRATRLSSQSYPFFLQLSDIRLNIYPHSYTNSTGIVQNTQKSVFPVSFDTLSNREYKACWPIFDSGSENLPNFVEILWASGLCPQVKI